MKSLNPEFALYGGKNKFDRTDTVFFLISQVCTSLRGVTFCMTKTIANYLQLMYIPSARLWPIMWGREEVRDHKVCTKAAGIAPKAHLRNAP